MDGQTDRQSDCTPRPAFAFGDAGKNAWSNFVAFFKRNHLQKTPSNQMRNEKFQKLGPDHFWTPYISITLIDRS